MKPGKSASQSKGRGGRPPKFNEPSRPVTVTLPVRILKLLESVDSDRAFAITRLVEFFLLSDKKPLEPVQVVPVSDDESIILVSYSKLLAQLPWLKLIEISPARFLLSVATDTPVEKLEVALHDLIETLPKSDPEHTLLTMLRQTLSAPRRNQTILKEEIIFIKKTR